MSDLVHEFLQLIRDAPTNDDPRWVLADWYEEHGDLERANLIRLQVERAGLPAWDARTVDLELKEWALLAAKEKLWRSELPQAKGLSWGRFDRGFVGTLAVDSVDMLMTPVFGECLKACPITGLAIRWPRLANRPNLTPIEGLEELTVVGTQMGVDDIKWLAASPLLSTIRTLNLVETRIESDGLESLINAPCMEQLRALRMPIHNLGNEGVELLVNASLPALVDLDLSVATADQLGSGGRYEDTMDFEGAAALAGWDGLARLQSLNLTGNQFGIEGTLALLTSPRVSNLKALGLRGISDWDYEDDSKADVLQAFHAAVPGLELEELDIGENDLNNEAARVLAESPALGALKVLHVDYNQNLIGFRRMLQAPWIDSVRVISASDGQGESLEAILLRAPKELHTVTAPSNYYWSQIEDLAGILLAAPPNPQLLVLNLGESYADDEALKKLGPVSAFPNLKTLRLAVEDPDFSEETAKSFSESAFGSGLVSLTTGYEKVDRLPIPTPISMGHGEYDGPLRHL